MNNVNEIPLDVLELMPWYLTEKLSVDDRDHFDKALNIYPELSNQLELERQMLSLVLADKSILSKRIIASPEDRLKQVFNEIDNPKAHKHSDLSNVTSMMDRLKEKCTTKLPESETKIHYSKVASVGIVVLSLATLSAFMISSKTETSDFSLASAKVEQNKTNMTATKTTKATILVGFGGTVDQLKNNPSLKGLEVTIQNAPDNDGIYQIIFTQTMTKDEVQQIINALQAQEDAVWFAGEAY